MPPKSSTSRASFGQGTKQAHNPSSSSASGSSSSSRTPSASSSSSSSSAPTRKLSSMLSVQFQPTLNFNNAAPKPKPVAERKPAITTEATGVGKQEADRKLMPPPLPSALTKLKQKAGNAITNGKNAKGKEKAREVIEVLSDDDDETSGRTALNGGTDERESGQMWTELYAPTNEADLAPGKTRIQRVKNWLHESIYGHPFDTPPPPTSVLRDKIRKYKRILLLSGPAGTGKTTTVRLLARDMGVELMEWGEGVEEWSLGGGIDRESSISKFTSFISNHSFPSLSLSNSTASTSSAPTKPRLILLTSLPNLSHLPTRDAFHSTLLKFCQSFASSSCPMIIVHSDAGSSGRAEESWMDRERGGREGALEVLGREVRDGPWCHEIDFLPLAPTFLTRALLRVLQTAIPKTVNRPSQSAVQLIGLSSHGDLRSAINSLQMVCSSKLGGSKKRKQRDDDDELEVESSRGKKKGKGSRGGRGVRLDVGSDMRAILDAVTRKEQSLNLFHALGKVFYNKRLDDPGMDDEDEEHLEMIRRLPPDNPLPAHLQEFARRKSLIQIGTFVPSIPVDASSFALWIHQSFPAFCGDIEQVSAGLDELCTADVMRTDDDIWQSSPQAIAYSLHLSIRGIHMALPSPVPRRSQKVLKPQFFESYRLERENTSALDNAAAYISRKGVVASNAFADGSDHGGPAASSVEADGGPGSGLGVWGGALSKRVVAGEMIPMMIKIQSASRRPLLPSSAQSLVLPPYSASNPGSGERGSELTAKDEPDQAEFEARPVEDEHEGSDLPGLWDEEDVQAGEGEDETGLGVEDDAIEDWD